MDKTIKSTVCVDSKLNSTHKNIKQFQDDFEANYVGLFNVSKRHEIDVEEAIEVVKLMKLNDIRDTLSEINDTLKVFASQFFN